MFLFSKLKKKQGFTLYEILMALGIIALLLIFIVPKIGAVKDQTKTAGVDTNLRMVGAYIQSSIENYKSDESDLLEEELSYAFEDNEMTNPFSKGVGVSSTDSLGTNGAAIVYSTSDNTHSGAVSTWESSTTNERLQGAVVVSAYPNPDGSDTLEVTLYPLDKKGRAVVSKKVIIHP